MSVESLIEWCSPETILLLTRPTDAPAQVAAAIRHSEAGSARILLAQLSADRHDNVTATFRSSRVLDWPRNGETPSSPIPIDRAVTWSDVLSQCFFISNVSPQDLPALVKAFKVGRIVVTAGRGAGPGVSKSLEETLLATVDVPLWIVGSNVKQRSDTNSHVRRVLFPITSASCLQNSLRFACAYTQSVRGTLTLLHIFDTWAFECAPEDRTPLAVKSRLPLDRLLKTGATCGMEISVARGHFAHELILFNEKRPHDVILMDGLPSAATFRQVLSQAECPVIVIRASSAAFGEAVTSFAPRPAELKKRSAM